MPEPRPETRNRSSDWKSSRGSRNIATRRSVSGRSSGAWRPFWCWPASGYWRSACTRAGCFCAFNPPESERRVSSRPSSPRATATAGLPTIRSWPTPTATAARWPSGTPSGRIRRCIAPARGSPCSTRLTRRRRPRPVELAAVGDSVCAGGRSIRGRPGWAPKPRCRGSAGSSGLRLADRHLGNRGRDRSRRVRGGGVGLRIHRRMAAAADALVAAVGLELPRLRVVPETPVEIAQDALGVALAADREGDLHAAEEVALHPVGARAEHVRLAAVLEVEHPRVLEEAPDDRAHREVLRYAGQPRAQ